jgi:hypothetical protein
MDIVGAIRWEGLEKHRHLYSVADSGRLRGSGKGERFGRLVSVVARRNVDRRDRIRRDLGVCVAVKPLGVSIPTVYREL